MLSTNIAGTSIAVLNLHDCFEARKWPALVRLADWVIYSNATAIGRFTRTGRIGNL